MTAVTFKYFVKLMNCIFGTKNIHFLYLYLIWNLDDTCFLARWCTWDNYWNAIYFYIFPLCLAPFILLTTQFGWIFPLITGIYIREHIYFSHKLHLDRVDVFVTFVIHIQLQFDMHSRCINLLWQPSHHFYRIIQKTRKGAKTAITKPLFKFHHKWFLKLFFKLVEFKLVWFEKQVKLFTRRFGGKGRFNGLIIVNVFSNAGVVSQCSSKWILAL